MLSLIKSKNLLTALLNVNWIMSNNQKTNPSNSATYFPARIYLGFLTEAPTVNANGEVTAYKEPFCGGTGEIGTYQRVELTDEGMQHNHILSATTYVNQKITLYDDNDNPTTITRPVAKVTNSNENIMFPYTGKTDETYAGYHTTSESTAIATITHFAIFSSSTIGSAVDTLWFYGPLENSVSVGKNVVPIILKNNLEITLG